MNRKREYEPLVSGEVYMVNGHRIQKETHGYCGFIHQIIWHTMGNRYHGSIRSWHFQEYSGDCSYGLRKGSND